MMALFGGLLVLAQGLGRGAVHLHAVLRAAPCGSSASRPSTTTAPPPWSTTARSSRRRRRSASPARSTTPASPSTPSRYCLEAGGIDLGGIDHVVFYDKPFLKFERLLETYLAFAPRGFRSFRMAMPVWLQEKLFQKGVLRDELARMPAADSTGTSRLLFTEHHLSHAA